MLELGVAHTQWPCRLQEQNKSVKMPSRQHSRFHELMISTLEKIMLAFLSCHIEKLFVSLFHTGWHSAGGWYGDVLWLPVPPGSDGRPWSTQDGSLWRHGHDRRVAGHLSLNSHTHSALGHQVVRVVMGGLQGTREVGLMSSSRCLTAPCPGWRVSAGDKVTVGLSLLDRCCLRHSAAL